MLQAIGASGALLGTIGNVSARSDDRGPPTNACRGIVQSYLSRMTDREKIGQMLLTSPYTFDATPDPEDEKAIQDLHLGTIGGPSTTRETPEKTATFANRLQELAESTRLGIPLLLNADFEYGPGQKLGRDEATEFPQQMGIGATRSPDQAAAAAAITAREARAMGIHWNNDPVADVNTNPDNPIIGWRSYGEEQALCAELIEPQVRAYQNEGMIASAKHFPGHGDTSTDSHLGLPAVTYDRDTLENVHLPPFQAAIDAGTDAVMSAHIVVEAIDPDLPATLSEEVLTGLLRDQMGFDGVVLTDDMAMQAIADNWEPEEAAVMAAKAGADVLMFLVEYDKLESIADALYDALQSGELSEERVDEAVRRVLELKCSYGLGLRPNTDPIVSPEAAADIVGQPAHRERSHEIARDAVTLVRNEDVLPVAGASDESIVVTGTWRETVADSLRAGTESTIEERPIEEVESAATDADYVVVTSSGDSDTINELLDGDADVIAIEAGLPYDIADYPDVDAALAVYNTVWFPGDNEGVWEAAGDVIGGHDPTGTLPVTVGDLYPFGHGLSY